MLSLIKEEKHFWIQAEKSQANIRIHFHKC